MKKNFLTVLAISIFASVYAATPSADIPSYYSSLSGTSGKDLVTELSSICNADHHAIGYNNIWNAYENTDLYPADSTDKAGKIWDMYSACLFTFSTDQSHGTNQSEEECSCYNREHSMPKSWFGGGTDAGPATDLHHIFPTDYYVNETRSNYPYGEVAYPTQTFANGSKFGACDEELGYTERVFEPIDQYKGDFARGYLYMLMKWNAQGVSFKQDNQGQGRVTFNDDMTSAGNYGLTAYGLKLLLKWHRLDPVSQKERDRNNAVQDIQGNRNPFVDYPCLAEYIWGSHKNETIVMSKLQSAYDSNYSVGADNTQIGCICEITEPTILSPSNGATIVVGSTSKNTSTSKTITVSGTLLTNNISLALSGTNASMFAISKTSIDKSAAEDGVQVTITYTPSATGAHTATLTLTSAGAATAIVTLTGSCIPEITSPANGTYCALSAEKLSTDYVNFSLKGVNIQASATLTLSGTDSEMFSVSHTTVIAAEVIQGKNIVIEYTPTEYGYHDAILTISNNDVADIVLYLSGSCLNEHHVHWVANGERLESEDIDVIDGEALSYIPNAPASTDEESNIFMGWSATPITEKTATRPTDLFTSIDDAPAITQDTTFYAIYAKLAALSDTLFERVTDRSELTALSKLLGMPLVVVSNNSNVTLNTDLTSSAAPVETDNQIIVKDELLKWAMWWDDNDEYFILYNNESARGVGATTLPESSNTSVPAELTASDNLFWEVGENAFDMNMFYITNKASDRCALQASGSDWVIYNTGTYASNKYCALRLYIPRATYTDYFSHTIVCEFSSITLDTTYVQTSFEVGDDFNWDAIKVTINYSNCESEEARSYHISDPIMSTPGAKTVTVTVTDKGVEKTAQYTIHVYKFEALEASDVTANSFTANWREADTESYTLNVYTKNGEGHPYEVNDTIVFEKSFDYYDQGDFTINDVFLSDGVSFVWSTSASYGMKGSANVKSVNYSAESWLISPVLDLSHATSATLTFDHTTYDASATSDVDYLTVEVSANGTDWHTLTIPHWPTTKRWTFENAGDIDISAYASKTTQIAFKYYSTEEHAGTWELKNVKITCDWRDTVYGVVGSIDGYPKVVTGTSDNVTGLLENTQYFYTITLPTGQQSKEIAVTTKKAGTTTDITTMSNNIVYFVANNMLHIEGIEPNSEIRLYDIAGRCIAQQITNAQNAVFSLPSANGAYIMKITTNNQTTSYKIVK